MRADSNAPRILIFKALLSVLRIYKTELMKDVEIKLMHIINIV